MGIAQRKQNIGPVSSSKRQKVADSPMVGPNVSGRGRQPLSNSNSVSNQPPPAAAAAADPNAAPGQDVNVAEFNSREDVDRLLNEKMKGKNKNDYKVNFTVSKES